MTAQSSIPPGADADELADFARVAANLRRERVAEDPERARFVDDVIAELARQQLTRGLAAPAAPDAALDAAIALRFDYPTLDDAQAAALVAGLTALEDALLSEARDLAAGARPPPAALAARRLAALLDARFVDGLHEPATAKVAKGPLVADGCGHGGCGHEHRQPVDHFTIFSHLEPIVVPWVTDTFGCPLERLAESSGVPKPPSEVL